MSENRIAGGYKAAIHNPNVSDDAKKKAADKLEKLENRGRQEKSESHVMGGYKATLKNPNVSEDAKDHAQQVLEDHGITVEASDD